jgi:hypothetical protein
MNVGTGNEATNSFISGNTYIGFSVQCVQYIRVGTGNEPGGRTGQAAGRTLC